MCIRDRGKTEQLKITYLPDYATASIGTVKWTSSNEAVVTVDAAGKLTAKAAGKAIITAITSDGNVTVSYTHLGWSLDHSGA